MFTTLAKANWGTTWYRFATWNFHDSLSKLADGTVAKPVGGTQKAHGCGFSLRDSVSQVRHQELSHDILLDSLTLFGIEWGFYHQTMWIP